MTTRPTRWQLVRHLPAHRIAAASDPTSIEADARAEADTPAVWAHFDAVYLIRTVGSTRTAEARNGPDAPWVAVPYGQVPSEARFLVDRSGVKAAA